MTYLAGNSGSPVLNGSGELIGLAFDGNYEALSHKIAFDKGPQPHDQCGHPVRTLVYRQTWRRKPISFRSETGPLRKVTCPGNALCHCQIKKYRVL